MPSTEHPVLMIIAACVCLMAAFPLARFFFDDFETFKDEFGLRSDWEQPLWLLGCVPSSPMIVAKIIGFLGTLAIVSFAVYSLTSRSFASQ